MSELGPPGQSVDTHGLKYLGIKKKFLALRMINCTYAKTNTALFYI